MIKIDKKYTWIIISFLIGTIFGSGTLWRYYDHKLSEEQYVFNKHKELRLRREDNLKKIMELNPEVRKKTIDVQMRDNKYDEELSLLMAELRRLVDDFNNDELELAKLEDREPLKLKLDLESPERTVTLDYAPPKSSIKINPLPRRSEVKSSPHQ
jgi:hypothetical protein